MADHGYQQYCALARALDVVGDRWTLLIVRELRPGPRRFTDLIHGLPGISRKLLTERLRDLEREGVIQRRQLPPPAARQVYELTEDGRELAGAMLPLAAWGTRRMGERQPGEVLRARWSAVGLVAIADRDAAKGITETYQYVVGDSAFHFIIDDGSIEARDGHADNPAVVVTTDEKTWADIASGHAKVSSSIAAGTLTITGDPQAAERLRKIFSAKHILGQAKDDAVTTLTA